jgi:molybdate transport system substrate-binding protein
MPDNVKVLTTIAMQAVLQQLEAELVQQTGHGIAMTFGPPSKATQLVRDGAPADVVMTTPDDIAQLVAEEKIVAGSGRVVARMFMGIAVRKGAPKPDISTTEKFRQAVLAAQSIVHAPPAGGSPSAAHFLKVCDRLGIADAVKAKTITRPGIVAHAVAEGAAEMAVQQMSELVMADVAIAGAFPADLQNIVPPGA